VKGRLITADSLALAMLVFGVLLLIFPAMRVPGLMALVAAAAYWLTMSVLSFARRRDG
jgi:hypothetical protein